MSTYCHQKRCLRFIPSILVVKCGFYDIYKRKSPASFLSHLENEKNDDDYHHRFPDIFPGKNSLRSSNSIDATRDDFQGHPGVEGEGDGGTTL